MEKKTADLKAYQKAYRESHPKDKEATNNYMKSYIKKAEDIECKICGGKYKSYSKYKHDATQKHIKALIEIKEKEEKEKPKPPPSPPKPVNMSSLEALKEYESSSESEAEEEGEKEITFKLPNEKIDDKKVLEFLDEHFKNSAKSTRSEESKTPRVNKNATTWKKVSKIVDGKTWQYLGKNFMKIVKEAYDKPSTQADTVVMLKLVMSKFGTLTEKDKDALNALNRKLKDSHISKQISLPENGVTYAEMKTKESDDDTTLALLMRLYNGDMPTLRIYDWINSVVGTSETLNEINLKKKVMIRRIVKNAVINKKTNEVEDETIELPKSLVEFIKKRAIKGPLLGDNTAASIDKLLIKAFPGKKANPRYFRDLYSTTITPTFSKEKLEKVLKIMNHSPIMHSQHYRKTEEGDALHNLIIGK